MGTTIIIQLPDRVFTLPRWGIAVVAVLGSVGPLALDLALTTAGPLGYTGMCTHMGPRNWSLYVLVIAGVLTVMVPAAALLARRVNLKWLFLFGALLATGGALGAALATDGWVCDICHLVQLVGGGMLVPVGLMMLGRGDTPGSVAAPLITVGAILATGMIAASTSYSLLRQLSKCTTYQHDYVSTISYDVSRIYFVGLAFSAVSFVAAGFFPDLRRRAGARPDILGALLAAPGVIFVLYGYASIPALADFRHAYRRGDFGWTDMVQSGLLPTWARGGIALVGVLMLIAYVAHVLRRRESGRVLEAS